jgi:hypothetical protein
MFARHTNVVVLSAYMYLRPLENAGGSGRTSPAPGKQRQIRCHAQGLDTPLRAGETAYDGLFRRLQQMEMRAAARARPRVGPPRDDFRIGHDLVIQQEQGDIGELLE